MAAHRAEMDSYSEAYPESEKDMRRAVQFHARWLENHEARLVDNAARVKVLEHNDTEQTRMLTEIRASVRLLAWLVPIGLTLIGTMVGVLAIVLKG